MARRAIIARAKETTMEINSAQCGRRPLRVLAAAGALACLLAACGHESPTPKPQPITQEPAAPQPQAQPAPAPAAAEAGAAEPAAAAQEQKPDPDKALAQKVERALRGSLGSLADGIDVTASGGKVTLWGTVPERAKQRIAVRTATGVKGVKSVLDNMSIVAGS
jgi:hypothetical protein